MTHTPDINAMAQQEETQRLETEDEYARLRAINADLLAALRRIFNVFEETGSWPLWATHQSFNGDPTELSAWEQARAAIEKAEGN